jgi:DNA-binding NarL/FixJ family response regulator
MYIKIALAEDNNFLVQSIKEKLALFSEFKFKFKGANGAEFIGKLEQDHNVDVILMDIQMPEMDGIQTTAYIKKKYPNIKVLMLTVFDDEDKIIKAIQAGADGYLLKDASPDELKQAITDVAKGGASMTPSVVLKTMKILRSANDLPDFNEQEEDISLSKRETEVLEQLSKGLNYQQIAENLFISPSTVRKHIENIYKKLNVHNKVEAVTVAMKNKLIV